MFLVHRRIRNHWWSDSVDVDSLTWMVVVVDFAFPVVDELVVVAETEAVVAHEVIAVAALGLLPVGAAGWQAGHCWQRYCCMEYHF